VAAQNADDFARYERLYAERFEGVKRAGSRTYRYDRAHWLADRRRMFDHPQHIVIGEPEIELYGDEAKVTFRQEWTSAAFGDRGRKQLVVVLVGEEIKIHSEEMLTSAERISPR
jgi:hypothetical protein